MRRITVSIATTVALLIGAITASPANANESAIGGSSSFSLPLTEQSTTRTLHDGLSIGLCADGTIDIAGITNEDKVYGVSKQTLSGPEPVMISKEFKAGELVHVSSTDYINPAVPAIPGLPVMLYGTKARIGFDDSIRAEYSNPVFMTVPAAGCHFTKLIS